MSSLLSRNKTFVIETKNYGEADVKVLKFFPFCLISWLVDFFRDYLYE